MAEVNVQKSSFFKEKKEEPNTDFSLVKGALTENINRLERLMNRKNLSCLEFNLLRLDMKIGYFFRFYRGL